MLVKKVSPRLACRRGLSTAPSASYSQRRLGPITPTASLFIMKNNCSGHAEATPRFGLTTIGANYQLGCSQRAAIGLEWRVSSLLASGGEYVWVLPQSEKDLRKTDTRGSNEDVMDVWTPCVVLAPLFEAGWSSSSSFVRCSLTRVFDAPRRHSSHDRPPAEASRELMRGLQSVLYYQLPVGERDCS